VPEIDNPFYPPTPTSCFPYPGEPGWPSFFPLPPPLNDCREFQIFDFCSVPPLENPRPESNTLINFGPVSILYQPGFLPDPCQPSAGASNGGGPIEWDYRPYRGFVRIWDCPTGSCNYIQQVTDWSYVDGAGFEVFRKYVAPGGIGTGMSPDSVFPEYLSMTHIQ
jgi:hypothetical protein